MLNHGPARPWFCFPQHFLLQFNPKRPFLSPFYTHQSSSFINCRDAYCHFSVYASLLPRFLYRKPILSTVSVPLFSTSPVSSVSLDSSPFLGFSSSSLMPRSGFLGGEEF
ncbi:hypothetical protein SLE2022_279020 [Rubroshorea leprosula]